MEDLPNEDDLYQYQYLRADNTVLGASIPFRLSSRPVDRKKDKVDKEEKEEGDGATAQEDEVSSLDSSLSGVSTSTKKIGEGDGAGDGEGPSLDFCEVSEDVGSDGGFAVVRNRTSIQVERYRSRCQELERQCQELAVVSESLSEELQEKSESFTVLSDTHAQMKVDLEALVKVKVEMEQQLHRALEDLSKMTTKVEVAQQVRKQLLALE